MQRCACRVGSFALGAGNKPSSRRGPRLVPRDSIWSGHLSSSSAHGAPRRRQQGWAQNARSIHDWRASRVETARISLKHMRRLRLAFRAIQHGECALGALEGRFYLPGRCVRIGGRVGSRSLPSGSRGLPSGKSRGAEWEVEWPRVAFRNPIENCKFPIPHYQLAADSSHDSPRTGCSPFPRPRRWALALRPEHHPRSDQSGHVEQPACRTRCPKEPHAQRSWHLQRSPPAQSEDLPPEVWLPTLSDDYPTTSGSPLRRAMMHDRTSR